MRKMSDRNPSELGSGRNSVFPTEVKVKTYSSDGGEGHIMDYPDTIEKIDRDQREGSKKMGGHKLKPGYRY